MKAAQGKFSGVHVDFDVCASMRDGVQLRADVYRPDRGGPWPTLLTRTPYDKGDHHKNTWCGLDPVQAARRGFMVIVQDVRGRFASDGEWDPFRFEAHDGYDSVEWAARLDGSNGRVGMYSASYCANTQLLAAKERQPSLAAVAPSMTWSDPMEGLFARGGAVELGLALRWALENGFDSLSRLQIDETELRARAAAVMDDWDRLGEEGYWELPVNDIEILKRHGVPDLGAIRALDEPRIAGRSLAGDSGEGLDVPSFHTAGWYDVFVQGTLDNFVRMAKAGGDARLIVGPWTHLTFADPIGERLFGVRAGRDGPAVHQGRDWGELQLAWFRRQLTEDSGVRLPEAPVHFFVMGRNQWREEPCWPPERAVRQRWFLRSRGGLSTESPGRLEDSSEFEYDPASPVPTLGGHAVMWPGHVSGAVDQRRVEARADVLVFTSEPLAQELEVTGRVRVMLWAQSSAPATDWVARLCDVHPDGRSFNVCDGILRLGEGAGECGLHEIDLWSTSIVFPAGHRLRVHVTSSSFPRWDRNLNTGRQRERRHEVARQRVHHAAERASLIELPIISRA